MTYQDLFDHMRDNHDVVLLYEEMDEIIRICKSIPDDEPGKVTVNGKLILVLESKQQWVNRVPQILPPKIRGGETWVWVDKNGDVFECGKDFMVAEEKATYPCKVYRLSNVAGAHETKPLNKQP